MLCVFPVAVSFAFQKYSATFTLPTLTFYELFAWLKVINLIFQGARAVMVMDITMKTG